MSTRTTPLTNRFAGEPFLRATGLGTYAMVRETSEHLVPLPSTSANDEACHRAIEDMQALRAGGWFGADDDGQWYLIDAAIAQELQW